MEIGNLVKEMLSFAPYINPPFAFQAPKEKRKCVHTNTKKNKNKNYIYIFYFLFLYLLRFNHRSVQT